MEVSNKAPVQMTHGLTFQQINTELKRDVAPQERPPRNFLLRVFKCSMPLNSTIKGTILDLGLICCMLPIISACGCC